MGRSGTHGKTFTGMWDAQAGRMHFDCAEDPSFWLEIDVSKIPHLAAAPGGSVAEEAACNAEAANTTEAVGETALLE